MEIAVLIIILLVLATIVAIRYDPTIDVVISDNKTTVLLWYNKYGNNKERKGFTRNYFNSIKTM